MSSVRRLQNFQSNFGIVLSLALLFFVVTALPAAAYKVIIVPKFTSILCGEALLILLSGIAIIYLYLIKMKRIKILLLNIVLKLMKKYKVKGNVKVTCYNHYNSMELRVTLYCKKQDAKKIYGRIYNRFRRYESIFESLMNRKINIVYNELTCY